MFNAIFNSTSIAIIGLSLMGYGFWSVYPPLAFIFAGVIVLLIAYGQYRIANTPLNKDK